MVKLLFAGPSLHGVGVEHPGVLRRPPASHGDIQAAVFEGATAIGLVDGLFETVAAVWHKEILFALSSGVTVLGGASLGALRAAECRTFGMVPVGEVARRYVTGELDDDAAVAQLHAPEALGFLPITEALVDCEAKIEGLRAAGGLDPGEASKLLAAARDLFFKARTWPAVLKRADLPAERSAAILGALKASAFGIKRRDALDLVERMVALPDSRQPSPPNWVFSRTPSWKRSASSTRDRPRRG